MYPLSENDILDLGFSVGPFGHTYRQDFHDDGLDFYIQLSPVEDSADWEGRVYGIEVDAGMTWVMLEKKLFRNKARLAEYLPQFGTDRADFQKVNRLTA